MSTAGERWAHHVNNRLIEQVENARDQFQLKAEMFGRATKQLESRFTYKKWVEAVFGWSIFLCAFALCLAGTVWAVRLVLEGMGVV